MKTYIVEIFYKKGLFDAFGYQTKKSIEELGIFSVKNVKVSQLYRFEGNINKKTIQKIVDEILLDKVSQKFSFLEKKRNRKNIWSVEVWYKKGVTDTIAETTLRAIKDLGIKNKIKVSTGTKYVLKGNIKKEEVETICQKILANPLIQNLQYSHPTAIF